MICVKRLSAFASALIMLITAIPCKAADGDFTKAVCAYEFLEQMNITSDADGGGAVSRGEFVSMLMKAVGGEVHGGENIFSDVPEESEYAPAVSAAAAMGIIAGSGGGRFNPEEPTSSAAAIKMTVSALGYEREAYARGGYPAGYFAVASDIALDAGIKKSYAGFERADAYILLYNFLTCAPAKITAVSGDGITTERDTESSWLKRNYGLSKYEGIVNSAGFASAVPHGTDIENKINIGGRVFSCDGEKSEKYLGLKVCAWYDNDGSVKYVYVLPVNKTAEISARDVESCGRDTLFLYDGSARKAVKLSPSLSFVENGRFKEHTDSDFIFKNGALKLTDNNGDGKIDVVSVKKYGYGVVSAVSAAERKIFTKDGRVFKIPLEGEGTARLFMTDKKGESFKCDIRDLSEDMSLVEEVSSDGLYTVLTASDKKAAGIVGEVGDDFVTISDIPYKLSDTFIGRGRLAPGSDVTLLVASDGTAAGFAETQKNNMQYGYYLDFHSKNTLSGGAAIKLLTEKGEILCAELEEKIRLNGELISKNDLKIPGLLLKSGIPQYQLVRYCINSDGKLLKLDTAKDAGGSVSDKYDGAFVGDDSLTVFLSGVKSYWHNSYKVFSPHLSMCGEPPVIFRVPLEISAGASKRYDDKYFEAISTQALGSYGIFTISAYDVNRVLQPSAMVVFSENSGGGEVREKTPLSIVEGVTRGINKDGEEKYFISMWTNGVFYKHSVSNEKYREFSAGGVFPSPGDIVRAETDAYGDISAMSIDAKYDKKKKISVLTDSAPADGQVEDSCVSGTVFSVSGKALIIKTDNSPGFNLAYSDLPMDGLEAFYLNDNASIAIFDTKTEKISQGRPGDIVGSLYAGDDSASRVVLKCFTHGIQQLFIYR